MVAARFVMMVVCARVAGSCVRILCRSYVDVNISFHMVPPTYSVCGFFAS